MEDYSIEFIKSYLWGKYIRKREKTHNPGHILNEFSYWFSTDDKHGRSPKDLSKRFFICDGCGKERIFYATYPIPDTHWNGLYCWQCWKKRTGAKKRVDMGINSYIFDNKDFIEYLDISNALEKVNFTTRQKHVLHFYMMEYSERMIADVLEISRKAVRIHLNRVFEKIFEYLNGYVLPKTTSQRALIVRRNIDHVKSKL
ncbi:MAG: regulatory protein [Candidatus Atribacteria bacterium ADurb.Bin276]|uniref:Regulatory protein n=1 Tax=Candidatus Atribacter allofermentans TaxID=1852833 RepID=A0A1V5SVU4_9BACT|nr:MAG: regulatory protein [Candidatus Atribacteria bacterium ADurb.Bin276]